MLNILIVILFLLCCVLKAISVAIISPTDRKIEKEVKAFSKLGK